MYFPGLKWLANFVSGTYVRLFFGAKAYGSTAQDYPGGGLIASNHVSFLDPIIVGTTWKEDVHFLARDSLFKIPILGSCFTHFNVHPVARGELSLSAVKTICRLCKEGKKVILFPEGRRSDTDSFQKAKGGIGFLAMRAGVPVIPCYVHGSYDAWNRHQRFPSLSGTVACVFGKPIPFIPDPDQCKKKQQQLFADTIMLEIAKLKEWYLNEFPE